MKKSLVLAMAMALGVTASAYAANPFSDVPAGHWAYDAVNKLAAEGVVDGYPDGTYGGDKLMTRYEMAQIVAKAMAKGANVDKLAAEFADELDSLGVRVANLEKKADNVKITGQIRASYRDLDNGSHDGYLRTRLFINGQINEDWSYTGRLENRSYYANESSSWDKDETNLNWAFVSGRVGGVKMDAGRMDFVQADVLDSRGDGVKLSYGDKVKVFGWALKAASDDYVSGAYFEEDENGNDKIDGDEILVEDGDRFYVAGVEAKLGAVDAGVKYYKADNTREQEIWEAAVKGEIVKELTLRGSYFYGDTDVSDLDGDESGWLVGLSYRGAKASKPGSWGVYANYSDRPFATYLQPTVFSGGYAAYPADTYFYTENGEEKFGDGYQGFDVGANVTLAKNIVAGVKYADFESREGNADEQVIWSEVVFTF